MPKLIRYQKKDMTHPLTAITDLKDCERILKTLQAIEGYVMCSCTFLENKKKLSDRIS